MKTQAEKMNHEARSRAAYVEELLRDDLPDARVEVESVERPDQPVGGATFEVYCCINGHPLQAGCENLHEGAHRIAAYYLREIREGRGEDEDTPADVPQGLFETLGNILKPIQ